MVSGNPTSKSFHKLIVGQLILGFWGFTFDGKKKEELDMCF